jgi:hypothetical protein
MSRKNTIVLDLQTFWPYGIIMALFRFKDASGRFVDPVLGVHSYCVLRREEEGLLAGIEARV